MEPLRNVAAENSIPEDEPRLRMELRPHGLDETGPLPRSEIAKSVTARGPPGGPGRYLSSASPLASLDQGKPLVPATSRRAPPVLRRGKSPEKVLEATETGSPSTSAARPISSVNDTKDVRLSEVPQQTSRSRLSSPSYSRKSSVRRLASAHSNFSEGTATSFFGGDAQSKSRMRGQRRTLQLRDTPSSSSSSRRATRAASLEHQAAGAPSRASRLVADEEPLKMQQAESRIYGGINTIMRRSALPSDEQIRRLKTIYNKLQAQGKSRKVVAFVNSKSGGQTGELIMQVLQSQLEEPPDPNDPGSFNAERSPLIGSVCDLSDWVEPEATIDRLAAELRRTINSGHTGHETETRLLVCGGDGTVTWILTALENCEALEGLREHFPVGIVPLGTGNDLARSLGWGPRLYSTDQLTSYLQWVGEADVVSLDRWRVLLRPHAALPSDHKLRKPGSHPQLVEDASLRNSFLDVFEDVLPQPNVRRDQQEVFLGHWQNYFSVGADAQIAEAVDRARSFSSCGRLFFRNGLGKVVYAVAGARLLCCTRRLRKDVHHMHVGRDNGAAEIGMDDLQEANPGILMFQNINSYAGGMRVVPTDEEASTPPKPGDGALEVMTARNMFSMAWAGFLKCGRPNYMCTCDRVAFTLDEDAAMQVDGEPWLVPPKVDIVVEPHDQVPMLRAPKHATWKGHIQPTFWSKFKLRLPRRSELTSTTTGEESGSTVDVCMNPVRGRSVTALPS